MLVVAVLSFAATAHASLDDIQVNGWVSSVKPEVNEPVNLTVTLRNAGKDIVGPVEIETLPPFTLTYDLQQPFSGLQLKPQQQIIRAARIVPSHKGPAPLVIQLRIGTTGDARRR